MAGGDVNHSVCALAQFYSELVDHHRKKISHSLSNNAILDWFGHSVIGQDSITSFFNDELPYTKHSFENVQPTGPIQHKIKNLAETPVKNHENHFAVANEVLQTEECDRPVTPDNKIPRPWDQENCVELEGMSELSLEDTNSQAYQQHHNICNAPIARKKKRWYFDYDHYNKTDEHLVPVPMPKGTAKFLEAFGTMEFIRQNPSPSSAKIFKRFTEQKNWKTRNCKIKIGYTNEGNNVQIFIIVYYDNMHCRKKLLFPVENDVD